MFNIPCKVVYLAVSALYVASCMGFDKTATGAMLAAAYVALALSREH